MSIQLKLELGRTIVTPGSPDEVGRSTEAAVRDAVAASNLEDLLEKPPYAKFGHGLPLTLPTKETVETILLLVSLALREGPTLVGAISTFLENLRLRLLASHAATIDMKIDIDGMSVVIKNAPLDNPLAYKREVTERLVNALELRGKNDKS